jgi:DNA-binding GntR family transcriptional regulator
MLATLYDHSERYRMVSRRRGTRDTVAVHRPIYESVAAGDVAAATAALKTHLHDTVELLETRLLENEMADAGKES